MTTGSIAHICNHINVKKELFVVIDIMDARGICQTRILKQAGKQANESR